MHINPVTSSSQREAAQNLRNTFSSARSLALGEKGCTKEDIVLLSSIMDQIHDWVNKKTKQGLKAESELDIVGQMIERGANMLLQFSLVKKGTEFDKEFIIDLTNWVENPVPDPEKAILFEIFIQKSAIA